MSFVVPEVLVLADITVLDKAVACDEALRSLKIPAAAFSASQKATMQTLYDAAAERYAKLYLGYSRGRAAKDSLDYFPSAEEAQFSASAALDVSLSGRQCLTDRSLWHGPTSRRAASETCCLIPA